MRADAASAEPAAGVDHAGSPGHRPLPRKLGGAAPRSHRADEHRSGEARLPSYKTTLERVTQLHARMAPGLAAPGRRPPRLANDVNVAPSLSVISRRLAIVAGVAGAYLLASIVTALVKVHEFDDVDTAIFAVTLVLMAAVAVGPLLLARRLWLKAGRPGQ